ncbi:MAG: hypothetical protein WC455_18890 [Dehalococcoidia bacterium]|jgi:hypothetical protein
MRFAYADPPYIGCAKYYPEKQEVDHRELIAQLEGYDGWALSASSPSLFQIVPMCPEGTRVAAWVKPFCAFKPNVNPAYAWEPVLFHGARKRSRAENTIRDWVSASITMQKGLVGAKPPEFCFWLFDLMGMSESDELHDLFPGTGIVGDCWEFWKKQRTWMEGA